MDKRCSRCKTIKHVKDFQLLNGELGYSWCTECRREYRRMYRTTDVVRMSRHSYRHKYQPRRKTRSRDFLKRYLSDHPCIDCGFSDIRALEFDHVRGQKKYNVSAMVAAGKSLDTIKEEIAKCDVRCANCHRIRHCKERQSLT